MNPEEYKQRDFIEEQELKESLDRLSDKGRKIQVNVLKKIAEDPNYSISRKAHRIKDKDKLLDLKREDVEYIIEDFDEIWQKDILEFYDKINGK